MTDTGRDIEAMAREAGLCCDKGRWFTPAGDPEDEIDVSTEDLARFAELVRADERERAAKVCEQRSGTMSMFASTQDWRAHDRAVKGCAAAIRALP